MGNEGRETKLQELVKSLVGGADTVLVKGPPGIGKSTLLRNAFEYILDRRCFLGGIIMVDLRGVLTMQALLRDLKQILIKSLKIPESP